MDKILKETTSLGLKRKGKKKKQKLHPNWLLQRFASFVCSGSETWELGSFLANQQLHLQIIKQLNFFLKVNLKKVNYFLMFGSVMKNKLENTFQCLVMS
jgi:hypothetical protein